MNKQWESAHRVIEMLEAQGFEAVIVGGAVRDYLLNRPFNDVDVATNALPEQVKDVFSNTVDVGIQHGTILVLDGGEPIEVTTYRAESEYVDYRRPGEVYFVRNLDEDLKRRDFTINAIAMRTDGQLIDLFGGQRDLQANIIRAVGDASERFQEDALRILRAIRFRAQLGFVIEDTTFSAIVKHAHLIEHISVERIVQELDKVFVSPYIYEAIMTIESTSLDNYLKGKFQSIHWNNVAPTSADEAWAYFYYLSNDEQLLNNYKCSNKRKSFVKQVNELISIPLEQWTPEVLFVYSLEQLQSANSINKWLGKPCLESSKVIEMKSQLPIQSMQELAVSGKALLEWNEQKRGPWIKEHLQAITKAVLERQVENRTHSIKEWYDEKFHER